MGRGDEEIEEGEAAQNEALTRPNRLSSLLIGSRLYANYILENQGYILSRLTTIKQN